MYDAVIIGAGLAGLCCARRLQQQQLNTLILEASDGVGGRIRTDLVEGFRLDRGFQVFLTSYPEAQTVLDYDQLRLRPFLPGALIRTQGRFHTLVDPWRRPWAGLRSLGSPIGTLADKWRVARLRARCLRGRISDLLDQPEITTIASLRAEGFSSAMIDRFFRPFLGGIFLEPALETSSRMFHFVFRMFAAGDAALPAAGMEAIPRQLADALGPGSIRFMTRAVAVSPGRVTLDSGEEIQARAVVVAADGQAAARLLGDEPLSHCGVTCLYFASDNPPIKEPLLVLNGEGSGPINNLCVPTAVAPTYGPAGQSLISATVLGTPQNPESLLIEVRSQLAEWFGTTARTWRHLRTYQIPNALPRQLPPALGQLERPVRREPGLYVCGDHRDQASIQGAMVSGRRAAEALLQDLS